MSKQNVWQIEVEPPCFRRIIPGPIVPGGGINLRRNGKKLLHTTYCQDELDGILKSLNFIAAACNAAERGIKFKALPEGKKADAGDYLKSLAVSE